MIAGHTLILALGAEEGTKHGISIACRSAGLSDEVAGRISEEAGLTAATLVAVASAIADTDLVGGFLSAVFIGCLFLARERRIRETELKH